MIRRRLLPCLSFLVLLTGLCAHAQAQDKPTVRFHVFGKTVTHLPEWVMLERGLCDKQGIQCEAVTLSNAPLALAAAAAGSVDIVNATIDTGLPAVDKGNNLQIVGGVLQSNPYALVVRSGVVKSGAATGYPDVMASLKGMKVGVASRGSSTEVFLKLLLAGAGLQPDSVILVPVGGATTAFAALAAKQIDAAVTWDPVPALCEATGACKLLVDMRNGQGPASFKQTMGTGGFRWATREYIEKHADRIDAFNRAEEEAVAWIKDPANAAEVLRIVKKNVALSPNIGNAEQAYKLMIADIVPHLTARIQPSSVSNWQDFLLENGLIKDKRPIKTLIYKNAPFQSAE